MYHLNNESDIELTKYKSDSYNICIPFLCPVNFCRQYREQATHYSKAELKKRLSTYNIERPS